MQIRIVLTPKQCAIPQGSVIFFSMQGYRLTVNPDKEKINIPFPYSREYPNNGKILCTNAYSEKCVFYIEQFFKITSLTFILKLPLTMEYSDGIRYFYHYFKLVGSFTANCVSW